VRQKPHEIYVVDKLRGITISRKIPENNVKASMMEQISDVVIQARVVISNR